MDVLDGDLEPVERARLGHLHLVHEARPEVLQHDAVRGGEEGEHVEDEAALAVGEALPVAQVVTQVDLLGCGGWGWMGCERVAGLSEATWQGGAGSRAAGGLGSPVQKDASAFL